jgi:hypothetical protein
VTVRKDHVVLSIVTTDKDTRLVKKTSMNMKQWTRERRVAEDAVEGDSREIDQGKTGQASQRQVTIAPMAGIIVLLNSLKMGQAVPKYVQIIALEAVVVTASIRTASENVNI